MEEKAKVISQKEYLKKYLSKEKDPKKKRKKHKISSSSHIKRSTIIDDDDTGLKEVASIDDEEFTFEYLGDEAPQIAGIIDERVPEGKLSQNQDDKSDKTMKKEKIKNEKRLDNCGSVLSSERMDTKKNFLESNVNIESRYEKLHTVKANGKQKNNFKSGRHSSDSDLSPERLDSKRKINKKKINEHGKYFDIKDRSRCNLKSSRRYSSDSDLSPERLKSKKTINKEDCYKKEDSGYSRRAKTYQSNAGNLHRDSSHRRHNKKKSSKDIDFDLYPRKKEKKKVKSDHDSDSDLSLDRYRKVRNEARINYSEKKKIKLDESSNKAEKTSDGKKAGLQSAMNLKEELKLLKEKEEIMYRKMDKTLTGEHAEVIIRDKRTGKIRNLNEEKEESLKELETNKEIKKKYAKWSKGLKQIEEAQEKLTEILHEINKPLARYVDDDDLDKLLKAREREGDPMLDYIRSKQNEAINVQNQGRHRYQGHFLPNRFGIPPGHRWDGVDRSNGYEKEWFQSQNNRMAGQEEAYKWSTSDM